MLERVLVRCILFELQPNHAVFDLKRSSSSRYFECVHINLLFI